MTEKKELSIDEMVDEIISKYEKKPVNLDAQEHKTPQSPFRYLTDEEIIEELNEDEESFQSKKIPNNPHNASEFWKKNFILGNSEKIETVLKKHENNKKTK